MSRTSKEIKEMRIEYLTEQVNTLKLILVLSFKKMIEESEALEAEKYILNISTLAHEYGVDLLSLEPNK